MKVLWGLEDLNHGFPAPVATIGNFDGMHLGHQKLVRELVARARQTSGTPTAITFEPHPLQVLAPHNAPRRIQTLDQKLALMKSFGIELVIVIPFTTEFARITAREFALKILADGARVAEIHVGPNFAFGHRREGSFNLLREIGEERGFNVMKIAQVQYRGSRVSSTAVRQALLSGQVAAARRLLGRPYSIEGEVVHGNAAGARIGFPTANLKTSCELIPRNGVYVTLFRFDGVPRRSVSNIGVRPTVSSTPGPVEVETHILDFSGNLYGRKIELEFLIRLREEKKFPSLVALSGQIRRDVERSRRYLRRVEQIAPSAIT